MKQELETKLSRDKTALNSYLNKFLSSNKRQDRDRVIKFKARIELLEDLLSIYDELIPEEL